MEAYMIVTFKRLFYRHLEVQDIENNFTSSYSFENLHENVILKTYILRITSETANSQFWQVLISDCLSTFTPIFYFYLSLFASHTKCTIKIESPLLEKYSIHKAVKKKSLGFILYNNYMQIN